MKKKKEIFETIEMEEGIKDFFKKVIAFFAKKLLRRNKYIVDFDFDIPIYTRAGSETLIGYSAYLKDDREIMLNYSVQGKGKELHSVCLYRDQDSYDSPYNTILLDLDASFDEINSAIEDLITGNLQEGNIKFSNFEKALLERTSPAQTAVVAWIEEPEFFDARLDIIQDEKLARVYAEYVRTVEGRPVSQASFITYVKQYLANNGLANKWTRGAYTVKRNNPVTVIDAPEDKPSIQAMGQVNEYMFTWKEAFEDLEDDFDDLMDDQKNMPFGQLVYGNGGTGKSYLFLKKSKEYDSNIFKGAPNTSRLVRILYDNRDKEVIIFDDADSIVTNANSANILKMATDDTVGANNDGKRIIYLPKGSGADMKGIVPDVYDNDGNLIQAFYFSASIVIITNLPDIKDKALKTRLYLNPIFMSKEDIVEKIMFTVNPSEFGATEVDSRMVADFLIALIEKDEFDISNDALSYRFFKIGLKLRKRYPNAWTGKLLRKLGIGIKSSYKDLKNSNDNLSIHNPIIEIAQAVKVDDIILEKGDKIQVIC
jgi:hypothetical protein